MVRQQPKKAIAVLAHREDLINMEWNGASKWIPGSTPLHWASHDGHLDLVKQLVSLGADVNAKQADWWCRPIDWAADSGRFQVVEYLLENNAFYGGDRWSNCTPLHAVAQGGSTNGKERSKSYQKTAEVLINGGADINAIARYGGQDPALTPLDDAQRVGNKAVAAILLKHGAKRWSELSE